MNPTEGCVVESDHWGALCIGATGRGASTDTAVDPGTQPVGLGWWVRVVGLRPDVDRCQRPQRQVITGSGATVMPTRDNVGSMPARNSSARPREAGMRQRSWRWIVLPAGILRSAASNSASEPHWMMRRSERNPTETEAMGCSSSPAFITRNP